MNFKEHRKKKDWVYYLTLMAIFAVVDFVVNRFAIEMSLIKAVVHAVLGGVFVTFLWGLFDHMDHDIENAVGEDKRKGIIKSK